VIADADMLRVFKAGIFAVDGDVLAIFEALDQPLARFTYNRIAPLDHAGKIGLNLACLKAKIRAAPRHLDRVGAADHGFARRAAEIPAPPAERPPFCDCDLFPLIRQFTCERRPRLSCPHDDSVEMYHSYPSTLLLQHAKITQDTHDKLKADEGDRI